MPKMYLFTYGTLMEGMCRYPYIACVDGKLIGKCQIPDIGLYNYDDHDQEGSENYPVALHEEGKHMNGEVYECDSKFLPMFDQIEGAGYLYNRENFNVNIDGKEYTVTAYIGVKKLWKKFLNSLFLVPYIPEWWKPTRNY